MPVTMKDVAKEAKLAVGTVSNYINGKKGIKPQNKEKIEKAIAALGYQVNEVARNLKMESSRSIGIIIPSFSNVFAIKTISHLEKIFRSSSYSLQVSSYNNSIDSLDEIINSLVGKRVEGLILMPASAIEDNVIKRLNSLVENSIPVVVFDSMNEGIKCDHVVLNNYEAMKKVTKKLFDSGHENIALLLGPEDISSSKERLSAYIDAHKERGLLPKDKFIFHTDYTKSMSNSACHELLNKYPEVSSILTAGYRITLGVLSAVNEKKLRIPKDISVFGFDTLDISDIFPFGLTGVYIPTSKVAYVIAEVMFKRIRHEINDLPFKKEVELEFISGNSIKNVKGK